MAIILNIDTAISDASVCIANDDKVLFFEENKVRNEQAAWLHVAVREGLDKTGLSAHDLQAIAISNGPGSYTGLRIGLATAKGLCYALNIPLICISTLKILAAVVVHEAVELIAPMIDARRMEVFAGLYDLELNAVQEPFAEILTENSFKEVLDTRKVLFTGNGAVKFEKLVCHQNASFIDKEPNASDMTALSAQMFVSRIFDDLAYAQPFYVKEPHITSSKASKNI